MQENNNANFFVFLGLIASIALIRLMLVYFTGTDLSAAESGLWLRSQKFTDGLWLESGTVHILQVAQMLCGSGEVCLRAPAVILSSLAALFIFIAANILYDKRTALLAPLLFLLMPGVSYTSILISDTILLLCLSSLALIFVARWQQFGGKLNTTLLGGVLMMGVIANPAMMWFATILLCYGIFSAHGRKLVFSKDFLIIIGCIIVGLLLILLVDFSHNWSNLQNWGHNLLPNWQRADFGHLFLFLGLSWLFLGVVSFPAYLYIIGARLRSWRKESDGLMLTMSLPLLLVFCGLSLFLTQHIMPMAIIWPGASLLLAAVIIHHNLFQIRRFALLTNICLFVVIGASFLASPLLPAHTGLNLWHEHAGWQHFAENLGRIRRQAGVSFLVLEDSAQFAASKYYLRLETAPILYAGTDKALMSDYGWNGGRPVLMVSARTDFFKKSGLKNIEFIESIPVPRAIAREESVSVYRLR